MMRHHFMAPIRAGLVLLAVTFGLFSSLATSAFAGEVAEFRVHGFSDNGQYFAFEEFGRQDGSGFVYSNIYLIDLEKDKWLDGSPVRVLVKDENQPVLAARVKASSEARPLLERYRISVSGALLAANPITEVGIDPMKLSFSFLKYPILGKQDKPYILQLWQEDAQDFHGCNDNGRVMGFGLDMKHGEAGDPREIYEDKEVPKSRNCPISYRLVAVYSSSRYNRSDYAVALVGVYQRGFEGPGMRYIAVPIKM
ncbi:DUF2259 domain-containing protein [Cohaesibacter gelatinilyticus]|uniref:Predicted secreted protein n=1 Tax=Cohaesibacter gelatinilyticus TaxID=372072 RepID=A0A285PJF1_9HYPH|nr:DUF2259 domain-containing protein [Cohaesibacter gelatinilyticus]SNZ20001.1 Predicted secreted protein [Cohaesibacter gelatinilyticus]